MRSQAKKKIAVLALIAICATIATHSTLAYMSYEDTAKNVITAGSIKIDLEESSVKDGVSVPFEDVVDVMPGEDVSKVVEVENVGSSSAWIRIKLSKTFTLSEGKDGTPDPTLVELDIDTEHWTEKDGIYYYNSPLAPGEKTAPLFKNVKFSDAMSNLYQYSKLTLGVTAQATQISNNGNTALEALGWPEI